MVQREYTFKSEFKLRPEGELRNLVLVNARESLGLTPPKAAEQIGIGYMTYSNCEALRSHPRPETQKKICAFYRSKGISMLEEDVFPKELWFVGLPDAAERITPEEQFLSLYRLNKRQPAPSNTQPEQIVEAVELTKLVDEALASLTKKEEQVLRMRCGFEIGEQESYGEIGKRLGMSYIIAEQVERKALVKLRFSAHCRKLRDFLG